MRSLCCVIIIDAGEGERDKITVTSLCKSNDRFSTNVNRRYFQTNDLRFLSCCTGKILGTDDPGGSKGLLKWKGVMFAPNDEVDQETEHDEEKPGKDTTDSIAPVEDIEQGSEVGLSVAFL